MSFWTKIRDAITRPFEQIGKFVYNKGGKDYSRTFYYNRDYIANGTSKRYKDNFSWTFKGTTTALVFGYFGTRPVDKQKEEIEQTLKDLENNLFNPLKQIDTQYQLGLSYSEIYDMIQHYAGQMNGSVSVNFSIIVGMITSLYTGGLSGALGLATTWYKASNDMYLQNQASSIYAERESIKNQLASVAILNARESVRYQKSERLTNSIIKDGYSIYANGSYFLAGGAGSDSYNSQNAYDNSKGLYGNNIGTKESVEFDDMVNLRNGKISAGGVDFYNAVIFEDDVVKNLASFNFIGTYYIQWKKIILRINEGVQKLNEIKGIVNGFNNGNDCYLTANGKLDEIYKRIVKEQTAQKKRQIQNEIFLEQMKNYSRGQPPQFTFTKIKDKKSSTDRIETTPLPDKNLPDADTYEEIMDSANFSDIQKITAYLYEIQKKLKKIYDLSDTRHFFVDDINGKLTARTDENGARISAGNLSNYDFMGGIFKGASISTLEIKRLYLEEFLPNLSETRIYKDENNLISQYALKISNDSYVCLSQENYNELKAEIYLPTTLENSADWDELAYEMDFTQEIN